MNVCVSLVKEFSTSNFLEILEIFLNSFFFICLKSFDKKSDQLSLLDKTQYL